MNVLTSCAFDSLEMINGDGRIRDPSLHFLAGGWTDEEQCAHIATEYAPIEMAMLIYINSRYVLFSERFRPMIGRHQAGDLTCLPIQRVVIYHAR